MSPYEHLPSRNFWRSAVAEGHPLEPIELYRKKFEIRRADQIATGGSCFAQHIARHLRAHAFSVLDVEPPPPGITAATAQTFGYGLFSARYANIYTARQLVQLTAEAFGEFSPEDAVWEKDGRYYDALRPSVEPTGLPSRESVLRHREHHLARVRSLLQQADVFIFTLGLTETWTHRASGTVYPTAPGTIAGRYDPDVHSFKNFTFAEIYEDVLQFRKILKAHKPEAKLVLTVSPVPLTATASNNHVLVATTYSKSVLRAVAGQLAGEYPDIDYFPSYEIVAGHPSRGFFFENNLRSVNNEGVEVVMKAFFGEHAGAATKVETAAPAPIRSRANPRKSHSDVVCEEQLLEAFAR